MIELQDKIGPEAIRYILDHPWSITENEWRLSKGNKQESFRYIAEHLKLARDDGYATIWRTPDQEPIAILCGFRVGEREFETLFVGSIHMEDHALKLSFDMRQLLREQSLRYRGCTCRLYSTSSHPKQLSWFRFLGFKHLPQGDVGDTRYFEYVSPG
jgi:hypothetical protein